jgi:hypothetical protein
MKNAFGLLGGGLVAMLLGGGIVQNTFREIFEYAFSVNQFGPEPSAGGFYVGALLGLVGLLMVMVATSWIGFELAMKERTAEKAEAH